MVQLIRKLKKNILYNKKAYIYIYNIYMRHNFFSGITFWIFSHSRCRLLLLKMVQRRLFADNNHRV